jgi:hypothetical protein
MCFNTDCESAATCHESKEVKRWTRNSVENQGMIMIVHDLMNLRFFTVSVMILINPTFKNWFVVDDAIKTENIQVYRHEVILIIDQFSCCKSSCWTML